MLAAEVEIPQMFTAYAEDLGYLNNGLHQYQYFCENCGQAFTSAWGRVPGSIQGYERGSRFYCPYCGMQHEKHVICVERETLIPNKVILRVKVFKNVVNFEVSCSTIQFRELCWITDGRYKEVFRFDITKQTTLFTRYRNGCKIESAEIGNPFKLDVIDKSILSFFQPFSLANLYQRSELFRALKVLRESVHKKLEEKLGYKLHSMHISPGQYHGTFLIPIFNIAYRTVFPDAPNLPVIYKVDQDTIKRFWHNRALDNIDQSLMDLVISRSKKTDFITALTTTYSLPEKPAVKKILGNNPFEVGLLSQAFTLCQNYDYAIRVYNGFKKFNMINTDSYYGQERLYQFLLGMKPMYGEAGIVHLIEKEENLRDCIQLYLQLNEENRRAIKTEHVKIKELHDWMARKNREQTHKNLKFQVPDHIVKRLSMQKDQLKFFLPKESLELLEAGAELHNCVASYGPAMKDNTKWVVLVANDKGKLAACLEVQDKTLVQAKIDRNKPVSQDPRLNAEVLAWAREAQLKIDTKDLNTRSLVKNDVFTGKQIFIAG